MWSVLEVSARDPVVPPGRDGRESPVPARPVPGRPAPERRRPKVVSRAPLPAGYRVRPEYFDDARPRVLHRPRPHSGRRRERARDYRKVTRAEREALTLETLGVFRVVSRRSLVDACFDGHPFAANPVLAGLERRGLVASHTVSPARRRRGAGGAAPAEPGSNYGYKVLTLTGRGRDVVAGRRRDPRRSARRVVAADDQVFWQGWADLRQLEHDHHVFDAVAAESRELEKEGRHIRRVRLEHELRGILSSAEHAGRRTGGEEGAMAARSGAAGQLGLRVVGRGVPLPDALVEIEHPDGSVSCRSVEVASGHYTSVQVAEKRAAGFRLYGWRSGTAKRGGTSDWEEFPLSWGR